MEAFIFFSFAVFVVAGGLVIYLGLRREMNRRIEELSSGRRGRFGKATIQDLEMYVLDLVKRVEHLEMIVQQWSQSSVSPKETITSNLVSPPPIKPEKPPPEAVPVQISIPEASTPISEPIHPSPIRPGEPTPEAVPVQSTVSRDAHAAATPQGTSGKGKNRIAAALLAIFLGGIVVSLTYFGVVKVKVAG